MDNLLLRYYEKELGLLRHSIRAFATRHPKIAAQLAISDAHSDDEQVEKLIQSAALLAAHLNVRIENEYPEFTEPLLEVLYPEYLRPIPSCSIACFKAGTVLETLNQPITIEKGTQLLAPARECRFQTVYDVTLSSLRIVNAQYALASSASASVGLAADTTGIMSITFAMPPEAATLDVGASGNVRIYLHGQEEVVAALTDTLLLDITSAYVEKDGQGKWSRLSRSPVSAVGFDRESLIGADGTSSAFSLLTEYLTFPSKFCFIDIDMSLLTRSVGAARQLALHLAVSNVRGTTASTRLSEVSEETFKLHCTPVVNLFKQKAIPVKLDGRTTPYRVLPKARDQSAIEIYTIDEVRAAGGVLNDSVIRPFYALTHGNSPHPNAPHWIMSRNEVGIDHNPSYGPELSIVESTGRPIIPETDQLTLDLTCTNRDRPHTIPVGAPGGDLTNETGSFPCEISLLSRPTRRAQLPRGDGALWRLIKFLTPHPLQISSEGLGELQRLFRQYATGSATQMRYLDGVVALTQRASLKWIPMKPNPQFVRGIEIELTIDEQAFVGHSISTFAGVMDRFFARYAPTTSFVQLVVASKGTGKEILRCPVREGTIPLL